MIKIIPSRNNNQIQLYGLHLGNRLPAHATSAGKILLAQLEPDQQIQWLEKYPLKRLTKYSCTNNQDFMKLLAEIKEQDWCYSSEEHELGVHALAVPIHNPKDQVIASLNIVSPTMRTTKEYLVEQILPLLQETARELRNVI